MKQRIHFCTPRDGIRVAYAAAGQGPPLLRLNNWFTHLDIDRASPVWQHWIDAFRTHYGPVFKAFGALDAGKQEALAADMVALTGRFNHATDGSMAVRGSKPPRKRSLFCKKAPQKTFATFTREL